MRSVLSGILVLALSSPLVFAQALQTDSNFMGFSPENSSKQKELEGKFDSFLKRDNLREWMKRLSARPHHVGSPYGKENAEFILSLFKSWGFDSQIESFDVLFPTTSVQLNIILRL